MLLVFLLASMPKRDLAAMASAVPAVAWYEFSRPGVRAAMSDEYKLYMANEWGHEKRGDNALFEKLSLEGAQAGLSWATILAKREGYRKAFHNFDISRCAAMTPDDVTALIDSDSAASERRPRHDRHPH